jgi:hypothetical protein
MRIMSLKVQKMKLKSKFGWWKEKIEDKIVSKK